MRKYQSTDGGSGRHGEGFGKVHAEFAVILRFTIKCQRINHKKHTRSKEL